MNFPVKLAQAGLVECNSAFALPIHVTDPHACLCPAAATISPSPGGEGRGEGERLNQHSLLLAGHVRPAECNSAFALPARLTNPNVCLSQAAETHSPSPRGVAHPKNPKGIPAQSPGLRARRATLGNRPKTSFNRNAVAAPISLTDPTARLSQAAATVSPSPGGEGRGEGERLNKLFPVSDRLFCPPHGRILTQPPVANRPERGVHAASAYKGTLASRIATTVHTLKRLDGLVVTHNISFPVKGRLIMQNSQPAVRESLGWSRLPDKLVKRSPSPVSSPPGEDFPQTHFLTARPPVRPIQRLDLRNRLQPFPPLLVPRPQERERVADRPGEGCGVSSHSLRGEGRGENSPNNSRIEPMNRNDWGARPPRAWPGAPRARPPARPTPNRSYSLSLRPRFSARAVFADRHQWHPRAGALPNSHHQTNGWFMGRAGV